jgi:Cu+-exporting ATPase
LASAQVGIALAGIGADLAAEAGDILVLGDPIRHLPELLKLSRATVAVIRQNIVLFAFGLNAVAMASASLGILGPVAAAVLHQAGSLLVLLNAMRLLAFGTWGERFPIRQVRAVAEAVGRWDARLDPGLLIDAILRNWRRLAAGAVVAFALVYATWGCVAIGPGEVGLVRRFGRYRGQIGPGLHLRLPPPVESVTRLAPERLRSLEIGFRTTIGDSAGSGWSASHGRGVSVRSDEEALLLTGDGQLVELAAIAQYQLDARRPGSLRDFAFASKDPESALRPLAESAVRNVIGRETLERLLTSARRDAERASARLLQARIDACGLGLEVTEVAFQDVHPPLPVLDAYRDVSRAESDRQRRRNEAATYQAEAAASARGASAATLNRAEADRTSRVERASAEAEAFLLVASARAAQPALNDHALYWEMISQTLAGKSKLVIDPAKARARHLIFSDGMPPNPPLLMPALERKGDASADPARSPSPATRKEPR